MIIADVNLIDGTGSPLKELVNVYVKDGLISKLESGEITGSGKIIDSKGKYLIPGLFDCHTHPDPFEENFPRFIHFGVTSILITGCSLCTDDHFATMRERGSQHINPAPRIFHTSQHISMEGRHPSKTYTSSPWRNGSSIFFMEDTAEVKPLLQKLSKQPIVGLKLTIEDGPHPPFVERIPQEFINRLVKEGERVGLEVFAHISDNVELEMAYRAGVQNLLHYTGVDISLPEHQYILDNFSERDVSWVSTLMIDKSFLYPFMTEWLQSPHFIIGLGKDEIERLTSTDRMMRYENRNQSMTGESIFDLDSLITMQVADIKDILANGINMVLGTDVGNDFIAPGYSLHEEMQMMQQGGLDPLTIIKMGTLNAAKMLHVEDSMGSIEEGKYADMVLLNSNPLTDIKKTLDIDMVIKNGMIQQRIENDN